MHATQADQKTLLPLKKRADFVRMNKEAGRWTSGSMVVQMRRGLEGALRLGITVTKRVDKRAVIRNRIRRCLRSAAADTLPSLGLSGVDIVLIGRKETLTAPYETLCKDLAWCIKHLHNISAHHAVGQDIA